MHRQFPRRRVREFSLLEVKANTGWRGKLGQAGVRPIHRYFDIVFAEVGCVGLGGRSR